MRFRFLTVLLVLLCSSIYAETEISFAKLFRFPERYYGQDVVVKVMLDKYFYKTDTGDFVEQVYGFRDQGTRSELSPAVGLTVIIKSSIVERLMDELDSRGDSSRLYYATLFGVVTGDGYVQDKYRTKGPVLLVSKVNFITEEGKITKTIK